MKNINTSQRNYGIDLLRIISMFFIVMLHILGHGGIINAAKSDPLNYNITWIIEISAYCAVNCYALISGYVGYSSSFRYTNIIMLWLRVLFYTVGITALFSLTMPHAVENNGTEGTFYLISPNWENALFPTITKQYWYFTAYVLCFFFTPILNKAVQNLERRQLKKALFAIITIISIPALYTGNDVFDAVHGFSSIWLIILYLLGAYIKKYNSLKNIGKLNAFMGYIACILVTWSVKLLCIEFAPDFSRPDFLISYTSPTIIGSGIFLFFIFRNLKLPNALCRIIALLSPLAFSVYLIHVHPFVWNNVIKDLFKPLGTLPTPIMLVSIIGAAVGLYLACSLIDVVRYYLFKLLRLKKLVFNIETKISEKPHVNK